MKRIPLAAFLIALYTVSFIAVVQAGIVSETRPQLRDILMFWLVLVSLLAVLILLLISAVFLRARMNRVHWFGLFSIALIIAGLWTSRFYDYRIDIVLTEGQVYETDAHRSVGLLYMGLLSSVPPFRLVLDAVEGGSGADNLRASARTQLLIPGETQPASVMISQAAPAYHHGMFLRMKNLGYSPRYVLKKEGRALDSNFISMRLIPSGSEDYFRLLGPHTFSLRVYPGHKENGEERPLKLKIARNKEIIFNEFIALNEEVPFEDASISFAEMRKWILISITRNWGELAAWAGLGLFLISAGMLAAGRWRRTP